MSSLYTFTHNYSHCSSFPNTHYSFLLPPVNNRRGSTKRFEIHKNNSLDLTNGGE